MAQVTINLSLTFDVGDEPEVKAYYVDAEGNPTPPLLADVLDILNENSSVENILSINGKTHADLQALLNKEAAI